MVIKKTPKKKSRIFQVIKAGVVLEFQSEPEGGCNVTVPSLLGRLSYGETFEQAIEMIKDAMGGWLVFHLADLRNKDIQRFLKAAGFRIRERIDNCPLLWKTIE